jgi:hypothetical protein
MLMKNKRRGDQLGIVSLVLTVAFWIYVKSGIGPNAFTRSPYVLYVLLPGMLVVAALVAAGAAFQGSKWWLLALVGPASGALLLFTASV